MIKQRGSFICGNIISLLGHVVDRMVQYVGGLVDDQSCSRGTEWEFLAHRRVYWLRVVLTIL